MVDNHRVGVRAQCVLVVVCCSLVASGCIWRTQIGVEGTSGGVRSVGRKTDSVFVVLARRAPL